MFIRSSLILLFLLMEYFAFAQGMQDSVYSLAPVIINGQKIFQKEKAGMKETKVDSLVLSQKLNLSLSELLSENTSVFIKNNGRGALATASFRGTAPSHTQVSWNGININSPMLGMVDFSLIPVFIIDDISLKHGTASIADKSGGLGGSINTSNTVNWNKKFELKYLQAVGSYDTYDEFLQIGGGNKTVHVKTRLYHNYSKNDFTFINRFIKDLNPETGVWENPLDTNDNAAYTRYGLLQEFYFRPNKKNMLTVRYWGQFSDRSIPHLTSYEGPVNSKLSKELNEDHKLVGDWKRMGKKSKLLFRSGYSGKNLHYSLKNYISGNGYSYAINSQSTQNSYFNSLSYKYNFNDKLSVEASIDGDYHDVLSNDSVANTGYHEQRSEYSAFIGVYKEFFQRLNINLLLRQGVVDGTYLPITPYLGFDYRIIKELDFLVKGNIAHNYHLPSLNDLYWQPGGNPNLLPEEGYSAELGIEYKVQLKKHLLTTELTAYRSDITNWIVWTPTFKGYWEPNNIKRVLSQGVELSTQLKGMIGKIKYNFSGSYAYTPSINYGDPIVWGDESYGKQLVYIPLHSGNAMLNFKYKGFFISYQHNSYGRRFTTTSNDLVTRSGFPAYFMNDITLGKEFKIRKIDFVAELKVLNMLNESYHSILLQPMPGRNYLLQLQAKI